MPRAPLAPIPTKPTRAGQNSKRAMLAIMSIFSEARSVNRMPMIAVLICWSALHVRQFKAAQNSEATVDDDVPLTINLYFS